MSVRARLVGLLATLTILGILIGLPLTLLAVGSNPVPHSMPSLERIRSALSGPDDGTLALSAVKAIAWAVWVFLAGAILLEIGARLRGIRAPHLPGLRLSQSAARGLVGTAMLLFAVAPIGAQAASATTLPTTHTSTVAAPTIGPQTPHAQTTTPAHAGPRASTAAPSRAKPAAVTHIVKQGQSLWSIAADHLGSGTRYPEIADLNSDVLGPNPGFLKVGTVLHLPVPKADFSADAPKDTHKITVHKGDTLSQIALEELGSAGRYPQIYQASQGTRQPDGEHLTDPDMIEVGWTLTVPGKGTVPGGATTPKTSPTPESGSSTSTPGPGASQHPPQGDTGAGQPETGRGEAPVPATPSTPSEPATSRPAPASSPAQTTAKPRPAAVTPDAGSDHGEQSVLAPWMLAGLTGGGAVLAGSMLLVLRSRRRAQFRARRPGRTIATPAPELAPVEKTIIAAGASISADVEFMDAALRRLAAAVTRDGRQAPEVAAVELTGHAIRLHLSESAELGQPWTGSDDQMHWTLSADTDLDAIGPDVVDQPAPYPLLVTIGASDSGDVWLLNVEDLDLSITGDTTFGRDFARYLAAEIACNPWSHGVRVDLVGVAEEVAPMNGDRVRVHTYDTDPAADVLAGAVAMIDRSTDAGTDVATARAHQAGADVWSARLLLVDAAAEYTPALGQLLDLVYEHAGHTGTCVVVHGDREGTPGVILRVTSDGRLTLPHAGLDLVAVGLTSDEAQGCAALLTQNEDLTDAPMPIDQDAHDGWRSWSNQAGALREEHTLPRSTGGEGIEDNPATSVLEHDDEEYVREAATTIEDLDVLAPKVPVRVREAVQDADTMLDEDLAAWWDPDCPLPRLALLGPIGARTRGTPVTKRKPYYTEILAFLATHAHGATPEELAEAFTITPAKARDYVRIVRDWLGVNPRTGQKHLPDARQAPAAKARGVGVYQVADLLVDADLFRRLRMRGESRGPDGVGDLRKALRLVQGRPFDKLRDGGWHWLSEGDRLDQHMICAIVDVAHLVTTYSLQAGDVKQARLAAETAALAAPDEEIPRLDLAAVADAEGHHSEADRILREEVCNRTDDEGAPPELSERTQQVIGSRDWQERIRQAS